MKDRSDFKALIEDQCVKTLMILVAQCLFGDHTETLFESIVNTIVNKVEKELDIDKNESNFANILSEILDIPTSQELGDIAEEIKQEYSVYFESSQPHIYKLVDIIKSHYTINN